MNGHVAQTDDTLTSLKPERTSRPPERPNISVAELAAMQRGHVERLGKLIEQLTAVMSRPNAPAAVMGSPSPARDEAAQAVREGIRDARLGKLTRTALSDGSAAYALRTDPVRSTVERLLGPPAPAFVERGASTNSPYLELVGTKDHEIAAAMAFAAQRWGNDAVIIHVGGRHTAKIIEHAVAQGLNIANPDAYIQSLVVRERARQADLAARHLRALAAADRVAVIERAPAAPNRSR